MSKRLIEVEPAAGGWRVLARQGAETMRQVTVVPSEAEAREVAECLRTTIFLAVDEALRAELIDLPVF